MGAEREESSLRDERLVICRSRGHNNIYKNNGLSLSEKTRTNLRN
jgi:spore cortex formation protein SpoVR/YcgB (stage V sporulation)